MALENACHCRSISTIKPDWVCCAFLRSRSISAFKSAGMQMEVGYSSGSLGLANVNSKIKWRAALGTV